MDTHVTKATTGSSFYDLPDELLLHILLYLDWPDLLTTSRVGSHISYYM